jgi:hypothetical protein
MTNERTALMVRVWAELGAGRISHDPALKSCKVGERLHCACDHKSKHIAINPVWSTVDTLIHELLHRLYPQWSENYVRRTTTYLLRRMTDDEAIAFYNEYELRARRVKVRGRPA